MNVAVKEYLTPAGVSPFRAWLDLLDVAVRARIQARIVRFELGNLGDHKAVGGGVWEARFAFGAGYRLYFAKAGKAMILILLLLGGSKASQAKDIPRARAYWHAYQEAARHDVTK
jgi:putative addiction module killer protein